ERRDERGGGAEQRVRPPREPVAQRAAALGCAVELADAPRDEHAATGVAGPAPRHQPQRATARGTGRRPAHAQRPTTAPALDPRLDEPAVLRSRIREPHDRGTRGHAPRPTPPQPLTPPRPLAHGPRAPQQPPPPH